MAIALVVAFHIFADRVSGGVDIFLLLSGYFFLGSQLRYVARPGASFNPWWPVWRTLRRLVPVLVLMVAAVLAAAWWWFPQWWQPEFLRQTAASVLYLQNWELVAQGQDYAVAAENVSPLQHLWSMSVQGQFYLAAVVFALLIGLVVRRRPSAVATVAGPVLVVATAASFAYAVHLGGVDQELNYYSTLSRMWQMTLGAVLAIYARHLVLPRLAREVCMVAGLVMVATTGLLFDGADLFPGPAALYPLGGAVLVILAGSGRTAGAVALTNPVSTWLGRIAYPFYVWHWPILIGATIVSGDDRPSVGVGFAVLAVSLVAADVTHRLVERPLRQHRARPRAGERPFVDGWKTVRSSPAAAARAVAGVVVVAAAAGLVTTVPLSDQAAREVAEGQLEPEKYPGALALAGAEVPDGVAPQPDPFVLSEVWPLAWRTGCITYQHQPADHRATHASDEYDNIRCVFGDTESETTVYLVGGSHAEHYSTVLDEIGQDLGFRLVPLIRQGCPLHLDEDEDLYQDGCWEFNKNVMDHLVEVQPDLVISTSTRPESGTAAGPDIVPDGYVEVWDVLAEENIPFAGLRDNPWGFDEDLEPMDRSDCVIETGDAAACGVDRDLVYAETDPAAEILAGYDGMVAIDTADWFCTQEYCPAVIGNVFVYRDPSHLSEAYTMTLYNFLADELQQVLEELEA
ncbi:acyltransferase [Corynebacterium yudongzhengii]|uniref:Acyltransferase n=1 Tax=Corynebacterium yudongzhengii TaxID=2080740 RepID=A0A2U1T6A4_9CORY|nr:acyltransferase [Corynebacterium yudongzhengii]PWC01537.1 acyltransferase [Corynebacterium yudongzhengii]